MLGIITSLDLLPYFFITKNVAGLLVIGADCWLTFNFISAQTRSSFLQNQAVLVPGSSSSRQFYSLEVIMQVILTLGYVFAFFNVEHYSTPQTISTICTRLFWIAVLSLQYIVCFLQLSTTENHLKIHSVPPPQSFTKPLNTTSTGIAPWGMLLINSPSFSSSNTVV